MPVVSTLITETFTFLDTSNALVTGKVNADFVKSAYLMSAPGTTAVVAVATDDEVTGEYPASFTPPVVGRWKLTVSCLHLGYTYRWEETFDIFSAAADGAALATAVAAVQTTVDGIDTLVDVAVSTRATPGAYVTTGSATATSGACTVYKGNDQIAVVSRSLDWATTTVDQWPDLTGATILLSGQYRANAAHTVSASGSVITPTGATKHARVELSAAQTEALHDGVYEIQVIATTAGGKVVTLVDTTMTVKPRKGP